MVAPLEQARFSGVTLLRELRGFVMRNAPHDTGRHKQAGREGERHERWTTRA
ncbi:MAG TPA: hypothetical protein VF306_04615 [Pirellulales bacterium]